ncbi:MAG: winged helix-turn-helix domain-containing protein [Solirubrobacteraceae bacterium]
MAPTGEPTTISVDLDTDVYEHLKGRSTFEDTISTVLRRELGLSGEAVEDGPSPRTVSEATVKRVVADRLAKNRATEKAKRGAAGAKKRARAAAGTLLPEAEYHRPILEVLSERGGRAPKQEVIEAVGERLANHLAEADRESLDSGGIRWESRTQFARLRLVDRGLMDRDAPRGIWAITPDGTKALEEGTISP